MGRFAVGLFYRAGGHGVTFTWRDGTATTYPARAVFRLEQLPSTVKGRAFRISNGEALSYEAPAPVPRP